MDNVFYDMLLFSTVADDMIIAFMLPESTFAAEELVTLSGSVPFQRLENSC